MKTKQEIQNVFSAAIESLSKEYKGSSLTDVFVLIDEDSGELSIFDDEENCVAKEIIEGWIDPSSEINYAAALKPVIKEMNDAGRFSSLEIYTPFSINLADEDFIVVEELLLIEDESIIRLEDDFLKRIDKEFDDFLDKLLKD